jgi:hypothetical protein
VYTRVYTTVHHHSAAARTGNAAGCFLLLSGGRPRCPGGLRRGWVSGAVGAEHGTVRGDGLLLLTYSARRRRRRWRRGCRRAASWLATSVAWAWSAGLKAISRSASGAPDSSVKSSMTSATAARTSGSSWAGGDVDHDGVGLGPGSRPQARTGDRNGTGVLAPPPERVRAGERDDRGAAVVADQRRQRHLGLLLGAVVVGLRQHGHDGNEQPGRRDGAERRVLGGLSRLVGGENRGDGGIGVPGVARGSGRSRSHGSDPTAGALRWAAARRLAAIGRLPDVMNSMKAALWHGYCRFARQNRLSTHVGYGNLMTCGYVQAP